MKTDKQLYKLFSGAPEYFFDLTGINCSARYTFRSETIKEISRSMDGLMAPDDPDQPHLVVEFQMQRDENIYYRIVMEMAALGARNHASTYHGIIIFADKSANPQSEPWSSLFEQDLPAFQVFYLDELLENLKEKEPGHPLLAVFQPYLQRDEKALEKDAHEYYNRICKGAIPENVKNRLCDIFISWMLIRFKNRSYQEVLKMLTLNTPLEETVAYKELVAIGETKGIKKGRQEGRQEGSKKAQIEVASKMLRQGFDHKTICELTGIGFDELQKIKTL